MVVISLISFPEWISGLHDDMLNEAKDDKEEWKKQRYCKKHGHLWEHETYGRCLRDCGWHKMSK
jgi:hypothetical protein